MKDRIKKLLMIFFHNSVKELGDSQIARISIDFEHCTLICAAVVMYDIKNKESKTMHNLYLSGKTSYDDPQGLEDVTNGILDLINKNQFDMLLFEQALFEDI